MTIVFVAKDFSRFSVLVERLRQEQDVNLVPVATGTAGLENLKGKRLDLVIVDEQLDDMSGIDFVKQFVTVNPLANTAILGSLPDEEFHEVTEGLGVLMQLPPHPGKTDAEELLAILAKISGLLAPTAP
ncbi:MAG: response regulator [Desulfobulbus sp.]